MCIRSYDAIDNQVSPLGCRDGETMMNQLKQVRTFALCSRCRANAGATSVVCAQSDGHACEENSEAAEGDVDAGPLFPRRQLAQVGRWRARHQLANRQGGRRGRGRADRRSSRPQMRRHVRRFGAGREVRVQVRWRCARLQQARSLRHRASRHCRLCSSCNSMIISDDYYC
jgi:hypothetical protein